jgi:hypothetical protein
LGSFGWLANFRRNSHMSAACLGAVYVIGVALAPSVGSNLSRDCDGCHVHGHIIRADGSMLDLIVGVHAGPGGALERIPRAHRARLPFVCGVVPSGMATIAHARVLVARRPIPQWSP